MHSSLHVAKTVLSSECDKFKNQPAPYFTRSLRKMTTVGGDTLASLKNHSRGNAYLTLDLFLFNDLACSFILLEASSRLTVLRGPSHFSH